MPMFSGYIAMHSLPWRKVPETSSGLKLSTPRLRIAEKTVCINSAANLSIAAVKSMWAMSVLDAGWGQLDVNCAYPVSIMLRAR